MYSRHRITTRGIMLIATLAAVYTILRIIPTFPLIGVPGARFSASDFVASLYGVILGPYASSLCIILGTFIGYFIGRPPVFYGLDFLPATINGLTVGLIVRGRRRPALLAYSILLVLFSAHPLAPTLITVKAFFNQSDLVFPFVWMHILGLIILTSPVASRVAGLITRPSVMMLALGFSLASFIGTLSQHLTGNILYASLILPLLTEQARTINWEIIFWLYPIERILIVVLSTLIGVPLIRALRSSGVFPLRGRSEVEVSQRQI
jgi:hypothetical protein